MEAEGSRAKRKMVYTAGFETREKSHLSRNLSRF
jgi:hypothetical protein